MDLCVWLEKTFSFATKKKPILRFSLLGEDVDRRWTDETTFPAKKNTFHTCCASSSARVGALGETEVKYVWADTFPFYKLWAAPSEPPLLVFKEKKVWLCINSLQCFARWGWTGAEGMEGCPGPTAAWHGSTENPSVRGTLHLLCSAHSTIDMRLPFVLSTKTIQVSPDRSRRTQYLTAARVQMCREQKAPWRWSRPHRGVYERPMHWQLPSGLENSDRKE